MGHFVYFLFACLAGNINTLFIILNLYTFASFSGFWSNAGISRRPRSRWALREILPVHMQRREREEKYGRRVAGITVRAISGAEFVLPTLTEYDTIPQDKREIPTPSMAKRFPHLTAIASEIPPLDETAKVHLLIGRDAPELLKVRESRNGLRGAPWGQRLVLGWTISGQVCLDFPSGPAHILASLTNLSTNTWREKGSGDWNWCPAQTNSRSQTPLWSAPLIVSSRPRGTTTSPVSPKRSAPF